MKLKISSIAYHLPELSEGGDVLKEDNPDWVADIRRIEAIDNDASDEIIEKCRKEKPDERYGSVKEIYETLPVSTT